MPLVNLTDEQREKLLYLCARKIGTVNRFVRILYILDTGDGRYKVSVAFKGYYNYIMIYDGKRIVECARCITGIREKLRNHYFNK